MLACHFLHQTHQQHVVVHGKIRLFEDGSELKLIGRHLVVTCLAWNSQLQGLYLKILHERCHAFGDGSEVVVVHLLVFCAGMSHQRTSGEQHVGACAVEIGIHEEIFLFPAEI